MVGLRQHQEVVHGLGDSEIGYSLPARALEETAVRGMALFKGSSGSSDSLREGDLLGPRTDLSIAIPA